LKCGVGIIRPGPINPCSSQQDTLTFPENKTSICLIARMTRPGSTLCSRHDAHQGCINTYINTYVTYVKMKKTPHIWSHRMPWGTNIFKKDGRTQSCSWEPCQLHGAGDRCKSHDARGKPLLCHVDEHDDLHRSHHSRGAMFQTVQHCLALCVHSSPHQYAIWYLKHS
jgi:hypothetical protein